MTTLSWKPQHPVLADGGRAEGIDDPVMFRDLDAFVRTVEELVRRAGNVGALRCHLPGGHEVPMPLDQAGLRDALRDLARVDVMALDLRAWPSEGQANMVGQLVFRLNMTLSTWPENPAVLLESRDRPSAFTAVVSEATVPALHRPWWRPKPRIASTLVPPLGREAMVLQQQTRGLALQGRLWAVGAAVTGATVGGTIGVLFG